MAKCGYIDPHTKEACTAPNAVAVSLSSSWNVDPASFGFAGTTWFQHLCPEHHELAKKQGWARS